MCEVIRKAPASIVEEGANDKYNNMRLLFHKDTINKLPRQLKRVLLYLLEQTKPRSNIEIMTALYVSDPRGHISRLRSRGYPIADEWRTTSEGNRFKCYIIRKEVEDGRE